MDLTTPTALAQEQTDKLHKTLGRFDIIFLLIAAVVGLETLGQVSTFGAEAFTWTLVLAVTFLVPYGLIFAETGAAFTEEGGAYTWVRDAFGRPAAAIAALLTWVTQPVWVGGSMAFLATESWNVNLSHISSGSVGDYAFKLVFIWLTVLAAIVSLRYGKWLPTVGALLKVGLLVVFVGTTAVYALQHGIVDISLGDFSPTLSGLLAATPVLLFAYLGFESGNSAAAEMKNPARDVPVSIMRSCATAAGCYLLPIFSILLVVPSDKITGIGGFFDATATVFGVYGAAAGPMLHVMSVLLVFILLTQGAAWMIISDRMQAIAAADGAFFGGFFGVFNRALSTPVRVNFLSGVVGTAFMLAALQVTGSAGSVFGVVLTISITTFLLSYLLVIPAAVRLRSRYLERPRPFRVPVSDAGFAALAGICFVWVLLGSWVAIFPGTLEGLFGVSYPFYEVWGVSRGQFEIFTLGTLAVLLVLGSLGYWRGARLRAIPGLDATSSATATAAPAVRTAATLEETTS
jgi:glutamate:GABA antiporter